MSTSKSNIPDSNRYIDRVQRYREVVEEGEETRSRRSLYGPDF